MTDVTGTQADATAIRPFTFEAAEADLEDLCARIAATRWPEKEPVDDQSQGVQLATIHALARYWETEYDWRKFEARLKALPQFITEIDGVDIHFIHVRSGHEDALPLIVTRGRSNPTELDGAGVSQSHLSQHGRQRRTLRGLGTAATVRGRGSRRLQAASLDDRAEWLHTPSLGGAGRHPWLRPSREVRRRLRRVLPDLFDCLLTAKA